MPAFIPYKGLSLAKLPVTCSVNVIPVDEVIMSRTLFATREERSVSMVVAICIHSAGHCATEDLQLNLSTTQPFVLDRIEKNTLWPSNMSRSTVQYKESDTDFRN